MPDPTPNSLPPSSSPPPVSASSPPTYSSHPRHYVLALVLFILGLGLGFGLVKTLPFSSQQSEEPQAEKPSPLTLPPDAVKIQGCSTGRGTLYVRPEDIPVGPVYMVHQDRIIGIEFMLARDEFFSGKSFKYLSGFGAYVDHVNVGLLSEGHEGYTVPHFHVDIYTVPRSVEESIQCPQTTVPTSSPEATNGAMMNDGTSTPVY